MSLKICWLSTAPFGGSSYSVLTKRTVPPIVRMGHQVWVNTWYGLQGEPQNWPITDGGKNGHDKRVMGTVQILPSVNGGTYGTDTVLAVYENFKCDVLITCMDIWVVNPQLVSRMKTAAWAPVDHDPAPQGVVNSLQPSIYPMSFSKWGADVLKKSNIDAHYVPCSADTDIFKPGDKKLARQKLGIPDSCDFLVTMVAANKDPGDRKGFGEAIMGFKRFHETHPNAMLYLHTDWFGPVNIGNLLTSVGLGKEIARPNALAYSMGFIRDDYMRDAYVAADVLLNPAKSEGFGLPILESQMCGTPVAITDFSTTDELLFAGWRIKGQPHWSIGADSWRMMAYIDSIVEVLEEAYDNRGNEILANRARNGAMDYDTNIIADKYWKPALKDIEDMVTCKGGELKMVTF